MADYGDLVGDPTEYNPERDHGAITTADPDVTDLLDAADVETDDSDRDVPGAVDRVRTWLDRHDVPLDAVTVYEHPEYGTVQIEKTGYIEDYDEFLELMRETDGIGYDGARNYCDPEWVAEL